mmetsp:Transcript_1371/g.1963  ORF Transcript_1371/g.1963 Transcript_1371/m.1963 type:complete len:243 (+) Transcript_1371:425-1153(+)
MGSDLLSDENQKLDASKSCTTDDIEMHRFLILNPYRDRKITVAIEERTKLHLADNVATEKIADKSHFCAEKVKFATYSEFLAILGLLRSLKILLVTGFKPNMIDNRSHIYESMERLKGISGKHANIPESNQSFDADTDAECVICMDADVEILLPCAHGFCSACAQAWVESHNDCPLCRRYMSNNSFRSEQWQIETWSQSDTVHQVDIIESRLVSQYAKIKTEGRGIWTRENVDEAFLRLTLA